MQSVNHSYTHSNTPSSIDNLSIFGMQITVTIQGGDTTHNIRSLRLQHAAEQGDRIDGLMRPYESEYLGVLHRYPVRISPRLLQGSRALDASVYSLSVAFEALLAHGLSIHRFGDLHRGRFDAPRH